MEKIKKFLLKISRDERLKIENIIRRILSGKIKGLDVKKLKGFEDVYRIRTGKNRIIFRRTKGRVNILDISQRADKTYKNF